MKVRLSIDITETAIYGQFLSEFCSGLDQIRSRPEQILYKN